MTTATLKAHGKTWTLTDEHSASSYDQPVLVDASGAVYGPWDYSHVAPQRTKGGGALLPYSYRVRARATAGYVRDDYPDDAVVQAMLERFLAIPNVS